jgi:hypothetical protein
MAFIKDNPAPATVVLISGDRDFTYLLSTIRWRKYNVVLISNSFTTHENLSIQASSVYDWKSDILKTRPPPKLPSHGSRREASSSVAISTTSQGSDYPFGSEIDLFDLPNECATPTIQPLAQPLRPVSIVATSTIHPTHAAPLSDAPFVEPEATHIPPNTEIPAEAAPASIPTTPTSDDRIVADLTSEPAIVHIDPVDEDGFYSPAFVSTCANVTPTQPLTPEFSEFCGNDYNGE